MKASSSRVQPGGPGAPLILSLLTPAVAFVAACGGGQTAGRPSGGGMPPAPVELAVVRQAPIEDATEYVGSLKSLTSTAIQPQVDGQITHIYVKSGDRVKAGDPLVQIDARQQQASVSSQQAEQAAREAAVALARSNAERARQLLAAGAISRQEVDQAEAALTTAEANVRSQDAQIQEGEVQLRYYTVAAPTAGIVGDVPVRVGNRVTSSTMLTSIDQNARLEVYVQVPLERVPDLTVGLPLRLLGRDGALIATTQISFVSPRVDDATQTVLAKAVMNNPGSLRSLQFVRAQIVWKTSEGFLIPILAVTRVNDQYFAFVAEQKDGALVARQRPIKVGPIVGNDYVLLSGIQANERLVVSGVQKLADGVPIAPQS